MSRLYLIPERMIPSELDLSVPHDKSAYECHAEKYYFAAIFVEKKRVLDVGCGAGFGSEILRKEGKASSVAGIDIDKKTTELARKEYGQDGLEFVCCSFDEMTGAGLFDAVVCINTLEYIPDTKYLLACLKKLLSGGGELIISFHITPTTDFNPFTFHDFSRKRVYRLLKKEGFRIEHEFLQVKHFGAGQAVDLMRKKTAEDDSAGKPRSLLLYFLAHPLKALKRVKSLLLHGLTVKTLTVRAKLSSPG